MKYDPERDSHNATRTSTRVSVKETQETLNASSGQENITCGGDSRGARTERTGTEEKAEEEERLKGNGERDNINGGYNIEKVEEKG